MTLIDNWFCTFCSSSWYLVSLTTAHLHSVNMSILVGRNSLDGSFALQYWLLYLVSPSMKFTNKKAALSRSVGYPSAEVEVKYSDYQKVNMLKNRNSRKWKLSVDLFPGAIIPIIYFGLILFFKKKKEN